MAEHFDLIVVGGGSGGMATARRAAAHGARVAMVERERLGGTCVNVGCVPKKVMWYASETATAVERAGDYGFAVGHPQFDWSQLRRARDAYVERLNGIYANNVERAGISLYRGSAILQGPRSVAVQGGDGDGTVLQGDAVVLAPGGRPRWPQIPGAEYGIDSDGFFALDEQPCRAAVVGAGYIAVELAGVLHHLGTETTLTVRRDGPLRGFDPLLREALAETLAADGLPVKDHFVPAAVERGADGRLSLISEGGERVEGLDTVIWAIGRDPNTAGLGLDAAGVAVRDDGSIPVDAYQQTAAAGLYALGDCTGNAYPLTPVAIAAGRRLADRLFGGQPDRYLEYRDVPSVVFTHPPLGTVGLTQPEAEEAYGADQVTCHETRFFPMNYALSPQEAKRRSAMKLVTVGLEQRVVGVHIFGEAADEMLQGFAVAVRMGATKADLDNTVAIHPTSAEELVTL